MYALVFQSTYLPGVGKNSNYLSKYNILIDIFYWRILCKLAEFSQRYSFPYKDIHTRLFPLALRNILYNIRNKFSEENGNNSISWVNKIHSTGFPIVHILCKLLCKYFHLYMKSFIAKRANPILLNFSKLNLKYLNLSKIRNMCKYYF